MKINENLKKSVLILSVLTLSLAILSSGAMAFSSASREINASLIKTEPVPLQTGEYADIWVKFRNTGDLSCDEGRLELVPSFPFSADPDEKLVDNFGKVRPGEEYFAHYQVRVSENAVQGENELKLKHSCGEDVSITETIPVQVRTDDAMLLVEKVNVSSGTIAPSKTESVEIVVKNLADSYLKNVDMSLDLSSENIPLITVGSSTAKRVSKIAPGESASVVFDIKADSGADQKAYKVPINLDYENEVGTSFSKSEQTGIVVGGRPELETNVAEIEGILRPGTTREVSFSLINRGLSSAKFVKMELLPHESYRTASTTEVYIGNMESDDYDSSTFKIYANPDAEMVHVPIQLVYKDSEGSAHVDNQTVSFRTYNNAEISEMNLEERGSSIYAVVILLVLVGGGYYLYRRHNRKKKKLLEE